MRFARHHTDRRAASTMAIDAAVAKRMAKKIGFVSPARGAIHPSLDHLVGALEERFGDGEAALSRP
jgi:hypothetical protein